MAAGSAAFTSAAGTVTLANFYRVTALAHLVGDIIHADFTVLYQMLLETGIDVGGNTVGL